MNIVVMGGGISGLATSLFLSRRDHHVTVIERDDAPPAAPPDEVFAGWERRGVPQARQPHAFLGRSVRVLRAEAPDVLDDLLAAGVLRVPIDLGDGPGDAIVCGRRLVYEAVLRSAVEREANVRMHNHAAVEDMVLEPARVPIVRGVRLESGDQLDADLVVDAAGRRSPTARVLAAHGLRPLAEEAQECGFLYISRHYRLHAGFDYPSVNVPIIANFGWAAAMAFPGDNGTFSLLALVAAIDPLRRELISDSGFASFLSQVPLTAPWLAAGEPISKIRTMARVENRYRRLVDDDGPIVTGMVLVGDSCLHTNPTAGRGVSLAMAHAEHLASMVDVVTTAGGAVAFDEWTAANVGTWYGPQAGADASLVRRMEAAVRGGEVPPPDHLEQVRAVMIALSKQPGPATLPMRRMHNLVALPAEVLGDPSALETAAAFLAANPDATRSPGPSRAEFADHRGRHRGAESRHRAGDGQTNN